VNAKQLRTTIAWNCMMILGKPPVIFVRFVVTIWFDSEKLLRRGRLNLYTFLTL
jgi:hypothetical protein